jgi:ParB family chromosome partitioning protein
MESWSVYPDTKPSAAARKLAQRVEEDGGTVLSVYQDPVGDHWQLFALLPLEKIEVTPWQRNLSPTHLKRLQEVIRKLDRFLDPIVVVSPEPGVYWTPNGNHRRMALEKLRCRLVPVILPTEPEVGTWILALNTEKAPNLKDKSLAAIRLYRAMAETRPRDGEEDYAAQLESAHFITLGLLYEENARFAGGAYAPILKRVDKFLKGTLAANLEKRSERAEMVREVDRRLAKVVEKLKKRGIRHPYVKNFVLARTTPLTRARKTLPSFDVTFRKLAENLDAFDPTKIRYDEVARTALFAAAAE